MSRLIYKQRCNAPGKSKTPMLNRNHLNYIANRPGSMKNQGQEHGLFGKLDGMDETGDIKDLDAALDRITEVSNRHTNVYKAVLSITEEDALMLGLDRRGAWERLLESNMDSIARGMEIPLHRLEWTASVHQENRHPHAHIMFWDREQGVKGYFTQPQRVNAIRGELLKSVFAEQFAGLYAEKTRTEGVLREEGSEMLDDMESFIGGMSAKEFEKYRDKLSTLSPSYNIGALTGRHGTPSDEALHAVSKQLFDLAAIVPRRGRLAYGYIPPDVKQRLDDMAKTIMNAHAPSRRAYAGYLKTAADISRMYTGDAAKHEEARRKAEERILKMLGNKLLDAIKVIREKENDLQGEQLRRDMMLDLAVEFFSLLSRTNQQEQAKLKQYKSGELSKAAKIELARRTESKGLDWDR